MAGSAITACIAMIETAVPFFEKLGVPIALAAVALWMALKSNQGRVNDLSNALKAREDDLQKANEHRIAMLTTLQEMSAAIKDQTTRTETKFDALLHAIERKQP
jgi:uncharacterized coiled-coil protein SlyX